MMDLTEDQKKKLTIWAYDRLWDMMDNGSYEGDNWFTVDSAIPELEGKIDVNLWDEEDEDGKTYIRASAYEIVTLPNGMPNTVCDSWERIF